MVILQKPGISALHPAHLPLMGNNYNYNNHQLYCEYTDKEC